VQAEGAVHATSLRKARAGLDVGWMRHLEPFHRSVRALSTPDRLTCSPTAVQEDADGHATPKRTLCRAPTGLGVGWMRQVRPSQRSTSVFCLPEAPSESPTAVHAERDEHPAPLNKLPLAASGLGVRWTLQLAPFHRSTRVTPTFEAVTYVPTPMHEVGLVQVPNSS
jgi:hypothetical protein